MGFLDILSKGIKAMVDEATTPESFKKGEKFEHYVREHLFISNYYDLVAKTHSSMTIKGIMLNPQSIQIICSGINGQRRNFMLK